MRYENVVQDLVHQVIESHAATTPNQVAVVHRSESITYGALNARANQFARVLQRLGVGPECLTAVVLERSTDFVAAMLGTWKAGGGCVLLEAADHPQEIPGVLDAVRPVVTVASTRLKLRLPRTDRSVLYVDAAAGELAGEDPQDIRVSTTGDNIACVTYDLGLAGTRNGMVLTHHALLRGSATHAPVPRGVWALAGAIGAERSVRRLVEALVQGSTVLLLDADDFLDAPGYVAAVEQGAAALAEVPALLVPRLARFIAGRSGRLPGLRELCVGAGEVPLDSLMQLADALPHAAMTYDYILSEHAAAATLPVSPQLVLPALQPDDAFPPTAGWQVLDERLLPSDEDPGEVFLAGPALPRGFHRRPRETAERFIAAPGGQRWYRTRQLGLRLPNGDVQLLGSSDLVTIRGCCVNLGAIETLLSAAKGVREAAVAIRRIGEEDALVAYIVPDTEATSIAALRDHAQAHLEPQMMPETFVSLDRLPRTLGGRIDRHALPALEPALPPLDQAYVDARNGVEAALVEIWQEALMLDRVGVHDDFLDIGGDSLIANQIAARVWDRYATEIPLQAFFEQCTVASLAQDFLAAAVAADGAR